ncbi:MAG: phasin family protein [Lysobacterales bacterium]
MSKPKFKSKAAPSADKSTALLETAQQVWMAGLDALNRAQSQGGKLFESLVKEGVALESKSRKFATSKVSDVRNAVEDQVGKVKERATDTWDKLEAVFESRVSRALSSLGVPGREEMEALVERVEELNRTVRKLNAKTESSLKNTVTKAARDSLNAVVESVTGSTRAPAARKPAAKKAPSKRASAKPAAKA